jgi:putative thiamine transport system ATP-binding protein
MHAEGKIFLNGTEITEFPAEQRRIGILFSEALLFPHLTVAENIGIGVASSISGKKRKDLITNSLIKAGLAGIEKQDPLTLSTGQQARIALLRTLLSEPALLLLDEPFSNLDKDIRKTLVSYVLTEIKRLNIPALMVSHDPRDAILSTNQPITFSPFDAKNP